MTFHRLSQLAAAMALVVVVLGAWVRLTDAGLGCPDWPGCYGRLAVPSTADEVAAANAAWPDRPLEHGKAWREMIHRYLASTLGLLVLALAGLALRDRLRGRVGRPLVLPLALVALVIAQGLLGMLTVTLLLKPLVVMGHLLGGMTTLTLLWLLALRTAPRAGTVPGTQARNAARAASDLTPTSAPLGRAVWRWRTLALAAVGVVITQIALGGWTSTNYAAMACPDFPTCQGTWLPETNFREGFVLWRGLGIDYEGGVLDGPARTAIHLAHRLGALVTLLVVGGIATGLLRGAVDPRVRTAAVVTLAAIAAQLTLGIVIVVKLLPLMPAVAHNLTAALLLLAVASLAHFTWDARGQLLRDARGHGRRHAANRQPARGLGAPAAGEVTS